MNHSPIHRFGKVLNLVLAFFVQRHPFAPQMEMLKSDIESLRKEFEIKKKELESNLRSQFTQDITELRAELERAREDSKEKNYHSSRLVFIHLYCLPIF